MVDVENEVFSLVAGELRELFPGINIASEYIRAPASFPHVSFYEADNVPYAAGMDSANVEKYGTVVYSVNVYSNKTAGKKPECRAIMAEINRIMHGLNFTRITCTPVPNMEDATIYRMTARFRAVSDGATLYRD